MTITAPSKPVQNTSFTSDQAREEYTAYKACGVELPEVLDGFIRSVLMVDGILEIVRVPGGIRVSFDDFSGETEDDLDAQWAQVVADGELQ